MMDYSSLLSRPISYFGKEQVWIARGDDVLLFNSHRSNIQNYLKHSGIPDSTQSPWIGLIRKLTRNVLRSSPIFEQGGALARFKVISKVTPPETATEPELTMQVDGETSMISLKTKNSLEQNVGQDVQRDAQVEITLRLGKSHTGDSYLCRQIQASQWSRDGILQSQTATAGPLLWLGDSPYQLTVEHVLNFSNHGADATSKNTDDDWDSDDEDDDDDGDDSNDCFFDEEIAPWDIPKAGIRSRTNSWTEGNVSDSASSNTVPELVTASSDPNLSSSFQIDHSRPPAFVDTKLVRPVGICDVVIHDFLSPFNSSSRKPPTQCRASSGMDYLLIPVPMGSETQPFIHGIVEMKDSSNAFSVHEHTEPRPVIIATASLGYVNSVMFPASTLSRKPGSQTFHTFFCIKSDQDMPKGTPGSAVFDTETGLLAGYIVLGCRGKNTWYMAPIRDVLDDIEANYGIVLGRTCFCEAVSSTMVTGENDHYWTAVCLNDEQPYNDQEGDSDTLEYEPDPIIAKHGTEAA
ncbi:hypothetical protein HG530_013084 [Fusarium avenaceum]|nr:hypothetical protein HG530_013084 [Fusarium avenaceum]